MSSYFTNMFSVCCIVDMLVNCLICCYLDPIKIYWLDSEELEKSTGKLIYQ